MRLLWANFLAGERPFWDAGKIGTQEYLLGFAAAENCIFEDGIVRKRLGVHAITKNSDLTTHTPTADPFAPGYGPYCFDKTGFYFFNGSGSRGGATDYEYQKVTFSPAVATPSFVQGSLFCYRDGSGNDVTVAYSPGGSVYYTNKGEFAVEVFGRRILARQMTPLLKQIEFHASRSGDTEDYTYKNTGQMAGTVITAGSFVKGQSYTVATVGTTDFTAIGASANTVGTTFVATGVGAGTGTATCYIQTLYPSDPIDLNYGAIGTILWMSQGFGLFIGTTVGVYQITSGLGPGFSPLSGGFLPNSLGNFFTMPVAWSGSRARNQCVTMTQESVVFVCSVDTVACLNRKARQINKMKLDVPLTHAIDSMAWLGGPHVAILLADIAARNSWGATGYNASNNIVLIVNEQTGTVSRFTGLNAFTIAGVGGYGLVFKASDGATIKVGAIPYLALERYASSPSVFDSSTFYDYSGSAYQIRILTLPLNVGKDIGDPRHPVRVRVRVHNSWSFSVRQNGQTLTTWTAADPGYGLSLPNLYTGDVELTLTSGYQAFTQIEITDNSSYPLEILAVQVDLTIQSSVEDGA